MNLFLFSRKIHAPLWEYLWYKEDLIMAAAIIITGVSMVGLMVFGDGIATCGKENHLYAKWLT